MSLIAWYKLDGDAVNSITGNSGTLVTVTYGDGKIGKCSIGSATTGSIIGDPITITGNFTLSVWAKKNGTSTNGYGGVAGNFIYPPPYSGFGLFFGDSIGNNAFYVDTVDSSGVRTYYPVATPNTIAVWNHYCIVYNDGWVSSYFNGVRLDIRQLNITSTPGTPLCIGRWAQGYGSYYFNGNIDDVRVYDNAISSKEVEELSRAKILHYKFDSFQEPTTNMFPVMTIEPYTPYHTLTKSATGISMTIVSEYTPGHPYITMRDVVNYPSLYGKVLSFSGYLKKNGKPTSFEGTSLSTYYQASGRFYFDSTSGYFEATQYYNIDSAYWFIHCPTAAVIGDVITIDNFQIEEKYHNTPFTDSSRTASITDVSDYGHHTTLTAPSSPTWESDGKFGRGKYKFNKDGVRNWISTTSTDTLNCKKTLSISLWFKVNTLPSSYYTLIGKTNDTSDPVSRTFAIFVQSNGYMVAACTNTALAQNSFGGPTAVSVGTWNHFTLVIDRDSSLMTGYLNGVYYNSVTLVGSDNVTHTYPLNIGDRTFGIYNQTDADIDDVRMYATALSAADVLDIYKSRGSIDADGNLHAVSLVETNHQPLLCNYATWNLGTGTVGEFSLNGTTAENMRLLGRDPWNKETILWEARKVDTTPDADGGWGGNTWIAIDNTKTYRFSIWIKRSVIGNGSMYFGLWGDAPVIDLSDMQVNTNPYFHWGGVDSTEWILYVGHVHPVGYTGPKHPDSGRYLVSGKLDMILRNFAFQATTTAVTHRAYLYYSSDVTTRQQFVYPRIDLLDGNEPTITELLKGHDSRNVDLIRSIGGTNPINMHVGNTTQVNTISEIGPTESLLAYYPLDGDIKDYSCNNFNGTTNTGAIIVPGLNNKECYQFNGTSDVIRCVDIQPSVNTTNNSWTCWCYPHTHTNTLSMIYGHYFPYMGMLYTGVFRFSTNISGTQRVLDTGVRTDNSWYNVVFTYDGTTLKSYINGVQSTSASYPGAMVLNRADAVFSIGHWNNTYADTFFFDGKIQDVRVYNKTLTDEEIMTLYQVTNPVTTKIKLNKRRVYLGGKIKETF